MHSNELQYTYQSSNKLYKEFLHIMIAMESLLDRRDF